MADTIKPAGIITFKPHEKAPDFVKGTMMITINDFVKFCKDNENLLTEYKGAKQLKCQILEGEHGLYLAVDTWQPNQSQSSTPEPAAEDDSSDLPF